MEGRLPPCYTCQGGFAVFRHRTKLGWPHLVVDELASQNFHQVSISIGIERNS